MRRKKPTAGTPRIPKLDSRLIGAWKSDRARTLAEWTSKKKLSKEKAKILQSLFGKLELTFGRSKVISKLPAEDWLQSKFYKILGADSNSVAIVLYGKDSEPEIKHVHFEKNSFWISLGGGRNREFFKRIRKSN
jgi:hypothetical protein